MSSSRILFQICLVIVIIGALNWGLIALDEKNDLIRCLFPNQQIIRSILYAFVGISGLIASYIWLSFPYDVCNITQNTTKLST
jgi:uncharacterized membrane protein YuzA (DUF378 family)